MYTHKLKNIIMKVCNICFAQILCDEIVSMNLKQNITSTYLYTVVALLVNDRDVTPAHR